MDAETKTYKWKVNVASLLHHLHNRDLTGFSPAGGEPWVGPCLWIKGTRSSYVDPTRHMETMKRCPRFENSPSHPLHGIMRNPTEPRFLFHRARQSDGLVAITH